MNKRDPQEIEKIKENFRHLTIKNDYIFCHVMKNKALCKEFLSRLLGRNVTIVEVESQASIAPLLKSKSVRLDILVKDDKEDYYNIEMQIVNNDSIPKRMRIYQASIDLEFFKKDTPYKNATDTIIIFICMFDPIREGLPIYTFKNLCEQNPKIELGDGTLKMIVVPKEWEKVENKEVQSVLRYIYENTATDEYTKELDMCVTDIKYEEVISNDSISYFFKMQDEREAGRKEGMQKGMQKGIEQRNNYLAKSFRDMGVPIDKIAQATGLTQEEIQAL